MISIKGAGLIATKYTILAFSIKVGKMKTVYVPTLPI